LLSQSVVLAHVISQTPPGQVPQFAGHGAGPPLELELALEALLLLLAVDDAEPDDAVLLALLLPPELAVEPALEALDDVDVDVVLEAPASGDGMTPVTSSPQPAAMPSTVTPPASNRTAIGCCRLIARF